jgi:predicted DNA-binding protein
MAKTEVEIVSAQLPRATAERLRALAEEGDRTLSAEIRIAVREHVREPEPPEDTAA